MDRRFHTAKSKIFEVQDAASDLLTAASLLDNAPVTRSSEESNSLADDYLSLVEDIKKKLSLCTTKNEEKALLTLLPRSWSIEKRKEVMGISHHMAYSSKLLYTDTLEQLNLRGNFLTQIPQYISLFKQLAGIDLGENKLTLFDIPLFIKPTSIHTSSVSLFFNNIENIKPGVFQGIFCLPYYTGLLYAENVRSFFFCWK